MRTTLAASMIAFVHSHQLKNDDDAHVIAHITGNEGEDRVFGGTNIFNVNKEMHGNIVGFKLQRGCTHSTEPSVTPDASEDNVEEEPEEVISDE